MPGIMCTIESLCTQFTITRSETHLMSRLLLSITNVLDILLEFSSVQRLSGGLSLSSDTGISSDFFDGYSARFIREFSLLPIASWYLSLFHLHSVPIRSDSEFRIPQDLVASTVLLRVRTSLPYGQKNSGFLTCVSTKVSIISVSR